MPLCKSDFTPVKPSSVSSVHNAGIARAFVPPADRDDLGTSLAAARAVTTSALLATFLCGIDAPFEAGAARENVRERLAALPPIVFADPELRSRPDAIVDEALTVLIRMGILAPAGKRYRLTGAHADARFPHVADMVTFQRNMLEETLAAAGRLAGHDRS